MARIFITLATEYGAERRRLRGPGRREVHPPVNDHPNFPQGDHLKFPLPSGCLERLIVLNWFRGRRFFRAEIVEETECQD